MWVTLRLQGDSEDKLEWLCDSVREIFGSVRKHIKEDDRVFIFVKFGSSTIRITVAMNQMLLTTLC